MSWDEEESPRPPMHTPIPLDKDRQIDRIARLLADCRTDLTTEDRHTLAGILAYRTRVYRKK